MGDSAQPNHRAWTYGELRWEQRRRLYRGGDDVESQLRGFVAWCRDHVLIAHPQGKRPFVLREPQIETARAYLADEQVLILKARQIGFTTLTMNFCLWRALFWPDYSIIVLSRREEDAKAALAMAKLAYDQLPIALKGQLPKRLDNNASKMTFANGSVIESHPAANNPARGRTASLMILDEWAFMPNPDDAWASVSPAADIGGRIIALSTANGWGNTYHSMWVGAEAGDNRFRSVFFPWWAVPERLVGHEAGTPFTEAPWYKSQQANMLPWQLAQEYPSDPEEAFIRSGNPVFDIDLLRGMSTEDPLRAVLAGQTWRTRELRVDEDGPLSVWESPKPGAAYVVGVDVAMGLEHGDYSSAHVIDVKSGVVVAHWHGHLDPDLFGLEMAALAWHYNVALLGVEVNNHGLTTVKWAQREGYPNLYFRRRLGSRREAVSEELGWLTTRSTKPYIIDSLAQALRTDLVLLDSATRQELLTYIRKADGSTEGSPHDDRVMSLAIANELRRHVHDVKVESRITVPVGSFAWELEQMRREEREQSMAGRALGAYGVRQRR